MALNLLLDTNAYVAFASQSKSVIDLVHNAIEVFLPFVALAELRSGFILGNRQTENERQLQRFLSQVSAVLYADDETTRQFARLFSQLRKQGTPIPVNDIWIASLALQYNLVLCTADSDFDHIGQLPLEKF